MILGKMHFISGTDELGIIELEKTWKIGSVFWIDWHGSVYLPKLGPCTPQKRSVLAFCNIANLLHLRMGGTFQVH